MRNEWPRHNLAEKIFVQSYRVIAVSLLNNVIENNTIEHKFEKRHKKKNHYINYANRYYENHNGQHFYGAHKSEKYDRLLK